jgi:hypothetical protein
MTPKEKAKDLYNKYEFMYIQNYTSISEVKQCATIAVNEIIDVIEFMAESEEPNKLPYWEDVKVEIQRLVV